MTRLVWVCVWVIIACLLQVEGLTAGDCRPVSGTRKRLCTTKISQCRTVFKTLMKWTGRGCRTVTKEGTVIFADGGCQCDQYCGYRCAAACRRDSQCTWLSGQCINKRTRQATGPISVCPQITKSPTSAPSKSPTTFSQCMSRDFDVDVLWALDESNSVAETPGLFPSMTEFVEHFLRINAPTSTGPLPIGQSRQAFSEFSGSSSFQPHLFTDLGESFAFSDFIDQGSSSFARSLTGLQPSGGFTRTDLVLNFARESFLEIMSETRRRILLLMTDGLPTDQYGFVASPDIMANAHQAASRLIEETGTEIILIRTSSQFPTGNQTGFLQPFVKTAVDFEKLRTNVNAQRQLFEFIFRCREAVL